MLEVNKNSYVTVEEADNYFNERLFVDEWDLATPGTKEKALIMATRQLDKLIFVSTKLDPKQELEFPRYKVDTPKEAAFEQALYILVNGNSKRSKLQEQGVKSYSIGNLSETFVETSKSFKNSPESKICSEAMTLLKPYRIGSVAIC
jgi:hypothetical protein